MFHFKNRLQKLQKSHLQIAGVLFLILLAAFLLWFGNFQSTQSSGATGATVCFDGEYRIGDGAWQLIEEGKHIPTPQGDDVTLRLVFYLREPGGTIMDYFNGKLPTAFYFVAFCISIYSSMQLVAGSTTSGHLIFSFSQSALNASV